MQTEQYAVNQVTADSNARLTEAVSFEEFFFDICDRITACGAGGYLIMTDDIPKFGELRKKAADEPFWYGAALPPDLQHQVDYIIRYRKSDLLALIANKSPLFKTIQVNEQHSTPRCRLVIVNVTPDESKAFGFYVFDGDSVPREERIKLAAEMREKNGGSKPERKAKPEGGKKLPFVKPKKQPSKSEEVKLDHTLESVSRNLTQNKPKEVTSNGNTTASSGKKKQKSAPAKRKQFQVIRSVKA